MSVECFILADFSFGVVALTSKDVPCNRSLDGVDRVYLPTINTFKLPKVSLNPLSPAGSDSSISFSYFPESLTPGKVLSDRYVLQGCDVTVWTESDGKTELIFEGMVDSAEFDDDLAFLKIKASRKSTILAASFPPARILDNNRFVYRQMIRVDSPTTEETYQIQILTPCPGVEFRSDFGTPSDPIQFGHATDVITFLPTEWEYERGGTVTISNAMLHFDDNQKDIPVPVCYGYHPNPVPLPVAFHYRVRRVFEPSPGTFTTQYYKIHIMFVGSHSVGGDSLAVPPGSSAGEEFCVRVFNNHGSNRTGRGFRITDRRGMTHSYVTTWTQYQSAAFDEQVVGEDIDETEFYMKNFRGKKGPGGILITGLGNVLMDAWNSYGGSSVSYVDWDTVSRNQERLNQLDISFLVNSGNQRQTLEQILFNRLGNQFPIRFGYPKGRLAWQSTFIDESQMPIKSIEMGIDLSSRIKLVETKLSEIINDLTVSFGVNGSNGDDSASIVFDQDTSEACRASVDRWGQRPVERISLADTTDPTTASIVGQQKILLKGGVRLTATYETTDIDFLSYPLLSVFKITDADAGIDAERFFLTGVEWNQKFTALTVDFVSQKMV